MNNNKWYDYWGNKNPEFDEIMSFTTTIFYEKMRKSFPANNDDVILDYGCGPGILINCLKDECKKVVGVDSSIIYVEKCKNLFKESSNVSVFKVSDFNDLERILRAENINTIIVLSVIQYFTSLAQLTEFLEVFRKSSNARGKRIRVLIADIVPVRHSMVVDFIEALYDSLKNRYFIKYLKFTVNYFKNIVINSRELKLQVDYLFFKKYADAYSLDICKIEGLTNHKKRYTIEIIFTT